MKATKRILFAAIMGIASVGVAMGQSSTLNTVYFLDNNLYRHNLNPAFTSDRGHISMPGLGNLNVTSTANIGLGAIMQPIDGKMVSFLHPEISVEDAMSRFKDTNKINIDAGVNVLSIGFNAMNGTNTIDINVRTNSDVKMPKSVFEFLKVGQNNEVSKHYSMNDIDITTHNFVELSLGHAHQINSKISIGAKVKFLVGAAYLSAHIDTMNVYMSEDEWRINQVSTLVTSKGMTYKTKADGEVEKINYKFKPGGFGVALDFGLVYRYNKFGNLSFSLTDLGFINWNDCQTAANNHKEFVYKGFTNIGVEDNPDGSNDFEDAADEVWNELKGLVKYYSDGKPRSKSRLLNATLRVGTEYGFAQNKISLGLLGTMRFGINNYFEGMLSFNMKPCKWFSAAVNGSLSNIGHSLGAVINFHPRGFNFFIGTDYVLARYGKQFIPIDRAKTNVSIGMNFTFNHGFNHSR